MKLRGVRFLQASELFIQSACLNIYFIWFICFDLKTHFHSASLNVLVASLAFLHTPLVMVKHVSLTYVTESHLHLRDDTHIHLVHSCFSSL